MMSIYIVQKDYQLPPDADWEDPYMNGATLEVGEEIEDGQIEPDIVAELVYRGVLVHRDPPVKPWADQPDIVREYDEEGNAVAVKPMESEVVEVEDYPEFFDEVEEED
jgi:hypothetical protein